MGEFEVLDTSEPLAQRMERHAYDRLIMLSDGVFAIAITLAALEIHVPDPVNGDVFALLHKLTVPLVSYAMSFAVIGVYWMAHRRLIARMRRVDGVATLLNLGLLAVVALQPLAVQVLMRQGPMSPSGQLYFGQVVAIGVIQSLLWGYAAFIAKLVDDSITRPARLFVFASSLILPALGAGLGLYMGSQSETSIIAIIVLLAAVAFGRRWLGRKLGL